MRLAPFQKRFLKGALKRGTTAGILSVARGSGKTTLVAGVALASLVGVIRPEPRRQILIAARSRDQARIAWEHAAAFARTLPDDMQARLTFRRSPRLEIEWEADDGPHVISAIAADAKNALGSAPSLVICDERAHWPEGRGDDLEQSLTSALHKRGGRFLMISTSAATDSHPFSRWIDSPPKGAYVQEHRPQPNLPVDDLPSLLDANPGVRHGIGDLEMLRDAAQRAIERGGHALSSFRLFNRNERVSAENRDVLVVLDDWLACETTDLPAREGEAVVGVDLGGSTSMSAFAAYWPRTGRLEALGAFPSEPGLAARGVNDAVGSRYVEMQDRHELRTMGQRTVPAPAFLSAIMELLDGSPIAALVADRFRQAEFEDALQAAGLRIPCIWRGQGFRDGGEDCERFRKAVLDGAVRCAPSLLMRSALADAVVLRDPANNLKLAKARSAGRIDAAAAAVLAVAEGARRVSRPAPKAPRLVWA
ncbi:MAG: terminase large subunit [Pseudomonadota bacterium]